MPTYDLHQHLWPASFVTALRERTTPPLLARDELVTREGRFRLELAQHDPETRLRALDRSGIDVAALTLQPSLGLDDVSADERAALEETWVEGVTELVASSSGRLLAFSPSRARAGFVGISLGSSIFADFDRSASVLDAAAAENTVVFVHPEAGHAVGPQPARLVGVGRRLPVPDAGGVPRVARAPGASAGRRFESCSQCSEEADRSSSSGSRTGGVRRPLRARPEHVLRRLDTRSKGDRALHRNVRRAPARLRERHAGRRPAPDP